MSAADTDTRRALHWVLKVGNLRRTLDFHENVLNMRVLRHEEFATGCEATCNGPYGGAWSKTMIGYGPEKTNFALELTYNYGVEQYEKGNDLRHIALHPTSEVMAHAAAQAQAHGGELVLTDYNGYQYKILPSQGPVLRSDPFLFVSINVADLDRAADYYRTVLGMREFKGVPGAERRLRSVMLGYSEGQAKLELVQLPAGEAVQHRKAFGRVAFATRQGARPVFDRVTSTGDRVINPPIVLTTPGKADVEVTILADRDGYEICFVGEAGFDDLSFAKPGDELIEWAARAARGGDGHPPLLTAPEGSAPLHAATVREITSAEELRAALEAAEGGPLLVDYMAPWCRNCRTIFPVVEALSRELPSVTFVKVDTVVAQELAIAEGVSKLPHFKLYRGGKEVGHYVGSNEAELRAAVRKHLA